MAPIYSLEIQNQLWRRARYLDSTPPAPTCGTKDGRSSTREAFTLLQRAEHRHALSGQTANAGFLLLWNHPWNHPIEKKKTTAWGLAPARRWLETGGDERFQLKTMPCLSVSFFLPGSCRHPCVGCFLVLELSASARRGAGGRWNRRRCMDKTN